MCFEMTQESTGAGAGRGDDAGYFQWIREHPERHCIVGPRGTEEGLTI